MKVSPASTLRVAESRWMLVWVSATAMPANAAHAMATARVILVIWLCKGFSSVERLCWGAETCPITLLPRGEKIVESKEILRVLKHVYPLKSGVNYQVVFWSPDLAC